MNYTEKVIAQSNQCYNDGLRRASIRDLSGAIVSLRRSLQYCRQNIAARNLLGLVYYGRGDINEALVEWIISKSLQPQDNVANYFIRKVQGSPEELEKINTNIKKYNQCLHYCQQDAQDLALIQLKKIVANHPDFVKAHQLLALLCIEKQQYARAIQSLKKAQKLDTTDTITLHYLTVLPNKKVQETVEEKEENVSYKVGNETIIQPSTSVSLKENASTITIMNILLGVAIGAAVVGFLINPAISQSENMRNANAIREYSKEIDAKKAQNNALSTELETYRQESEAVEEKAQAMIDTKVSYEVLYELEAMFESGEGSTTDLVNKMLEITKDGLGETGLKRYEVLYNEIFVPQLIKRYNTGSSKFEVRDRTHGIQALEDVIKMEPSYENYNAMYMLAIMYYEEAQNEDAAQLFEIIIEEVSDRELLASATEYLDKIENNEKAEETIEEIIEETNDEINELEELSNESDNLEDAIEE